MNHPIHRIISIALVFVTGASAASLPTTAPKATPVAARDAADYDPVISLSDFDVSTSRWGPPSLYGEVEGIQILSLCSERETRDFARDLQVQRFVLEQMLPEEMRVRPSSPLLVIFKPWVMPDGSSNAGSRLSRIVNLTFSDLDTFGVIRVIRPSTGPGIVLPMGSAYPAGIFINNAPGWLPRWVSSDLSGLISQCTFVNDSMQLTNRAFNLGPEPLPPIGEFFYPDAEQSVRVAVIPPSQPSTTTRNPLTWHSAFTHWIVLGGQKRMAAYWEFARQTSAAPATEEMFQACFGVAYAEMQRQVRALGGRGSSNAGKISTPKPPDFLPIALHPVTKTELARVKNEWKRLAAVWQGGYSIGTTPELSRRLLADVVRDLEAAYAQGERDPQTIAELALAECDAGRDEQAIPFLEAAVQTRLARPRIYYELARLRYQATKAAVGPNGTFDSAQVAAIMEPLTATRGLVPALREVCLLMVDTLSRASDAPSSRHLEILDEGLRQFAGRLNLSSRIAALKARADSSSGGISELPTFFPDVLELHERAQAAAHRSFVSRPSQLGAAPSSIQIRAIPPADAYRVPRTGDFVFNLMPKSLQLRPLLDMTVATSFTNYGRLIRPATPQDPVYYVSQSGGFRQLGDQIGGVKSPSAERLEAALRSALAANGYLAASAAPGQAPTLAIIFSWGMQNKPWEGEGEMPNFKARIEGIRERHALVFGGLRGSADWDKSQELFEQANDDLYFVVASAYDYNQLAQGSKKLIWRTTMTASARGVAMTESLPPLIASAAPYLGREMAEPELTSRRISRVGHVEIGTLRTVADEQKPAASPPPEAPPAAKP